MPAARSTDTRLTATGPPADDRPCAGRDVDVPGDGRVIVSAVGAAALAVLAAWGIHARSLALGVPSFQARRDDADGATTASGSAATLWYVGGAVAVILVALIVAIIRREHRRRKLAEFEFVDTWRPSRWAAPAVLVLLAAMVTAVVLVLRWTSRMSTPVSPVFAPPPGSATAAAPHPLGPNVTEQLPGWAVALLIAAALAVVAGVVWGVRLAIQHRAGGSSTLSLERPARQPEPPHDLGPDRTEPEDPRARVLARYQDFESAIQAAGVPVSSSDTSGEIADRTLLRDPDIAEPVSGLTDLFRRARYSTAALDIADAEAADRHAVRAISESRR